MNVINTQSLTADEATGLLKVITDYAYALDTLDRYDYQSLEIDYTTKECTFYDLQREYWNNGYITEALKVVIDFGFNSLEINRIEAEVMQSNVASEKVLEKPGFKNERIFNAFLPVSFSLISWL
ncbi:MAG: GNAT family N-acetyltransferase [Tannerellaceae bacterium]|jgi:RimJ/RimL family protein N-acetyltransferase|nr:GNAT family N-acetyltransferase [Tannerellaceae bacterium]